MICDGTSTKSRGNPPRPRYGLFESSEFSAWPNSWKSVPTSSSVSSAGSSPAGREKLHTLTTTGVTRLPSFMRVPRNALLHAPTRLPGRGW